ncbi:ATP-binding protein [Pseudonocardia hispaniensis]|uniref:ATP-binding protein n=1 Tax=Pseudonocardia hispaniensis TaxID=904933 RepID=A0ABW1J617_9PSEU
MSQGPLRLRLLGPFTVEGELAAPVPVGKARRVLAVLAERAGEFVPLASLVDALWESDPPERADRNVAALVSRLRRALGRERIDGSVTGYRLVLDGVSVDIRDAIEHVTIAERELGRGRFALASTSAEHAAKLLGSDVALAGERDDQWIHQVRLRTAGWLRRARICWGTAALELGDWDVAAEVAGAALRTDPLDEQACRIVMSSHQRAGRSAAALLSYRQLQIAMSEQLGSDPSPATQAVHLAVLRSEDPGREARSAAPLPAIGPKSLVGRTEEYRRLHALWADSASGSPVLALVTGEAGIGKTALVDTFAVEPERTGALTLPVACFEAERSVYLQPLAKAVRSVIQRSKPAEVRELAGFRLGTLTQLVPELADVLGPVEYERAGPALEHGRTLDALVGFFVRLSARQPVLLTIDDAQHAGPSTIEALHYLASHWAGSRIMMIVIERTADGEPQTAALRDLTAASIHLGPLSADHVATLVDRAGVPYDPAQLYAWTGGSPLFVTELLRHPARATTADPAGTDMVIPWSLHEAVEERIARSGEDTAAFLAQGAILGAAFTLDGVAELSGIDVEECARRAGRAMRAGLLLARGDSFRFPNDIVRQVMYEATPEPVRISRHRRAAGLLQEHPEAAARHLAAAGDWSGAARSFAAAAHTAHLAFANAEAVDLLTQAIDAAQTSGDTAQASELLLRRGRSKSELGRHEDARADHEDALALARARSDSELEARALEQLGWTALYARDALQAVDFAKQATELAESAAAAPGALPSAMLLLGRVRHWDGEYSRAETAYTQVLAAEPGDTTAALALAYRGALLQHQDRFAEARTVLARAAVLCRRTGEFRPMLQTLFFTALARGDSGDFAGALRALDNARRLIDAEKVSFYRAGIETTTSWIWQELGHLERARDHAEQALELARRGGGALELEQELHAVLALADCDLLLGREETAAAAVSSAAPLLDQPLPFRPRAVLRLLEMQSRWDGDQAEALLIEARRYSSRKYEALALRALGRFEEAGRLATATGSDLLVGQLGAPAERRTAIERIAAALPAELRSTYASAGRLNRPARPTR